MLLTTFAVTVNAEEITDGTYEVQIALWHSEDDKESMAADAIDSTATIVVKNGVKTMHITCKEMKMMGIKASLQELRIADSDGNYTDAVVESRNSNGDPTGFYFELPHTEEYITVKVNPHIAMMGNKDIGARIKVDYSTLKSVEASETETTTQKVTTTVPETTQTVQTTESTTVTETEITTVVNESTTEASETVPQTEQENSNDETKENDNTVKFIIIAVVAIVLIGAGIGVVIFIKKRNEEE